MSDSESDRESFDLQSVQEVPESEVENEQVNTIRRAVQEWKTREIEKNTESNANAPGLNPLRKYVNNAARLYYDLNTFLTTSKNNEKNMSDKLYVNIVSAIGNPGALSFTMKTMLDHFFQRDLIELPYTMNPVLVNQYAKNGTKAETEFPEEE